MSGISNDELLIQLRIDMKAMQVKMNIIGYLAGSTVVGLIGLIVAVVSMHL